jgi:transposase-like protein
MKTQLSKPARVKASYTDEYKQEALELWRASGRSAAKVAAELGIRPPLLYRWARSERDPNAAKVAPKLKRSVEELKAENRRLVCRTRSSNFGARAAGNGESVILPPF